MTIRYIQRASGIAVIQRQPLLPSMFGATLTDGDLTLEMVDGAVVVTAADIAYAASDGIQNAALLKQIPVGDVFPQWDVATQDLVVHLYDLEVTTTTPELYVGVGFASTGAGTEAGSGIFWNPDDFTVGCMRNTATYESTKSVQSEQPTQIWGRMRLSPATIGCSTQALVAGEWMGGETDNTTQSGLGAGGELFICVGHEDSDTGDAEFAFKVLLDLVPKLDRVEATL